MMKGVEGRRMPDTPTLEISRLQEIFEDDTAGIAELLDAAMQTGAGHQAALREGIGRREIDGVMRAAHAIKGSSANIGGNEVAAIAARIESAARANSWQGIDADSLALDAAYERLRAAVAAYRASVV
jgi:HPt (histidine-containing phosphotransfer) domain-containing protein